MTKLTRMLRRLAFALPLTLSATLVAVPLTAQTASEEPSLPAPSALQTDEETPWIYEGSDVPRDKDWLFGEMDNGLRYAVRNNRVPPNQVSIRIRIDAGSLHERDDERGFAHFLEHLSFRESTYLKAGEAIPRWQRLGATFGSDTNAETSPTHTVYKLDLPNTDSAKIAESFKLLSGMMRDPVLSQANLAAELPIVLAEKRERGGAGQRVAEQTREVLFAGQRLASRLPIGTEATLTGATPEAMQEFHRRWYRPENTVIVVAGDADPLELAALVEKWFGDWQGKGGPVSAPDFGDPVAPAGADPDNPIGEVEVLVEPDLPRSLTYAVMRPWRPVQDTILYNEGLLMDSLAQALINRRLEARARGDASYLYAAVQQDDVSRSTDATFVSFAPLGEDWQAALADVRGVIADALATPPTQEEIDREVAEFDSAFASSFEQRSVQAGSELADNIVNAVDIRETVAAPDTVLNVFRGMTAKITPERILERTRALFEGDVIRGVYVTQSASEADDAALKLALSQPVEADTGARLAASTINFADLPPIGEPGSIVAQGSLGLGGLPDIERIDFDNGVKAILWANDAEPGRVALKVRFGAGMRAFDPEDAPYISLGEAALVSSGIGNLGQEEIDRLATGRRMGFEFGIEPGTFTFTAQTRGADLTDQLYLFAAKLGMPRWDANPFLRAKAGARIAYESFATSPGGVINRDLDFVVRDGDVRYKTPDPADLERATPEGFREVWDPLLKQGPVEVLIFGEFDRDEAIQSLAKTFGALPKREPIPAEQENRVPRFPTDSAEPVLLTHRGDADQGAAVVAWPTGGGIGGLPESRQLEILTQVFNNRLLDEMRERAGASYAPQVASDWPDDIAEGGTIMALAQLKPEDVPTFFAVANEIAQDIAATPPSQDELDRVTEPLRQLISRASSGNGFWLFSIEGSTVDSRRLQYLRSLLNDYSRTTPAAMQALAQKYLTARPGLQIAILPEGRELAQAQSVAAGATAGR